MSGIQYQTIASLVAGITPNSKQGIITSARIAGSTEGGSLLDAVAGGRAVVFKIGVDSDTALRVANIASNGNSAIQPDRVQISKAAQAYLDGLDGSPKDGQVSVNELAKGLQARKLAVGSKGIALDNEIVLIPSLRVKLNSVDTDLIADVGLPLEERRNRVAPLFSVASTTIKRALPQIRLVLPTGEGHPDLQPPLSSEKPKLDAVAYFARNGALQKKNRLIWLFSFYHGVKKDEALKMLTANKTLYLGKDKVPIKTVADLEGQTAFVAATEANFKTLQDNRESANRRLVEKLQGEARSADIGARMAQIPPLNSIIDTSRLLEENLWLKEWNGFDEFIFPIIGALSAAPARLNIAKDWQKEPEMTLAAFNTMALGHIANAIDASVSWRSNFLAIIEPYILKD